MLLNLLGGLSTPINVFATPASSQQQAAVAQVLKENKVNGIALVNGEGEQARVISHQVTSNQQQRVTADRLFPVASFQKLMTGIAVMTLVNDNKLSLQTPLSRFLPQLPYAGQITVDQLMTHTSGLHTEKATIRKPLKGETTRLRFALHHSKSTGNFNWHYDDLDFIILAAIIRWTSHQSYRHYLSRRVLKPVGVTVKFYDQVHARQVTSGVAKKQRWTDLQMAMSKELGAGDIFCTPRNYWQFYNRALLDKPSLLAQFTQKRDIAGETYFGGIYLEEPYLHANGYLKGYSCTFYSNYHTRQTIMLFANNLSYHRLRKLNAQLYHAYFGDWRQEQKTINAN